MVILRLFAIVFMFSFVKEIQKNDLRGCVMASFDVTSLFTNIPLKFTTNLTIKSLFHDGCTQFQGISQTQMKKTAKVNLPKRYFPIQWQVLQTNWWRGNGFPHCSSACRRKGGFTQNPVTTYEPAYGQRQSSHRLRWPYPAEFSRFRTAYGLLKIGLSKPDCRGCRWWCSCCIWILCKATLIMNYVINQALTNINVQNKLIVLCRCVDDIFVAFNDMSALNIFFNALNNVHNNITFTKELECGDSLPYLDVLTETVRLEYKQQRMENVLILASTRIGQDSFLTNTKWI